MYFFILGFLLGIVILLWNRYHLQSELKNLLTASPDTAKLLGSLPISTLIKREIIYIQQQSDQKQQELDIKQEILNLSPIAYLRVDQENQLLWCNQKAQELLYIDRWQPGQVRLLLELVRSYELDQLIEETRQTQTPQVNQWTFYPSHYAPQTANIPNSTVQPLTIPSIPLKGFSYPLPQGQIAIFIENQQPLVELSCSRDRAFSDLTHELRTPLTSIALVSEWLENRLQDPERRRVSQMLEQTQRLMSLVEDWLELSQLQENPYHSLSLELLNLEEVINSAWEVLEPLAERKEITLNFQGTQKREFFGDRSRFMQVFINLFDNSIKHSPSHSEIMVNLIDDEQEDKLEIHLLDQGSGFSEEDLPYIFERLYRGDTSRTRQSQSLESLRSGSGLGLAIAKEIIESHEGTIIAKNHPDTEGAWIQILLTKIG
ncbi:MAG: ATP-binding protein [Crocosphaera sp.]|nr:ATP-binding protein [Crocosphaera sp.]